MRTCVVFALYYFLFSEKIVVGDLLTMVFFTFFIFNPLQELSAFIIAKNETKVSMKIYELLNAKSEHKPETPEHFGKISSLVFKNVSFQHKSAKQPAVENIDFNIKQGETICFCWKNHISEIISRLIPTRNWKCVV